MTRPTKMRTMTVTRQEHYRIQLEPHLMNARAIQAALPNAKTRDLFRPFAMIPLSEWFSRHLDVDGRPQAWLREALLACEAAVFGTADPATTARQVSEVLARHLPNVEDEDDLAYVRFE